MSTQEILEAHTQSIRNGRCSCEDRGTKRTVVEHRAHLADVLATHMQEREAKAWDEGQDSGFYNGRHCELEGYVAFTNPYRPTKEAHDGR